MSAERYVCGTNEVVMYDQPLNKFFFSPEPPYQKGDAARVHKWIFTESEYWIMPRCIEIEAMEIDDKVISCVHLKGGFV